MLCRPALLPRRAAIPSRAHSYREAPARLLTKDQQSPDTRVAMLMMASSECGRSGRGRLAAALLLCPPPLTRPQSPAATLAVPPLSRSLGPGSRPRAIFRSPLPRGGRPAPSEPATRAQLLPLLAGQQRLVGRLRLLAELVGRLDPVGVAYRGFYRPAR